MSRHSISRALMMLGVLAVSGVGLGAHASAGDALHDALEHVPASAVPSGILADRALPIVDLAEQTGRPGETPITYGVLQQMRHQLERAATGPVPWRSRDEMRAIAREHERRGDVPVAILDVIYDRLDPSRVASGDIVTDGAGHVAASGADVVSGHAFAAAATCDATSGGEAVRFVLDPRLIATNADDPIESVRIDPGDGLGFRALSPGRSVVARYTHPGTRHVRVRHTTASGVERDASFTFEVTRLGVPLPDDTLSVTGTVAYAGDVASGDAYVYLAEGHTEITNPIVVIEGFDLEDNLDWDDLYLLLNQENLLESLRALGYDAVVLDFVSPTTYIQRNAYLVMELLAQVNAVIAPDQDLVLVGASMGGLCCRYALAYMEANDLDANVRTFISFDAPQTGANIPLGIQYWVAFFADDSADAASFLESLDSPGARQMLRYHHTSPAGTTGEPDPLRDVLVAELAALGDYPSGPRLVCVSNGSGIGADQGYGPGAQIIRWEYSSFLVDLTGNVWALPDGSSQLIFAGLLDILGLPAEVQNVTVSGTSPWDNAPGGLRPSMAQMDAVSAPFGDIVALHPSHCFIPTVSALGLETDDPFMDVTGASTPFVRCFVPDANEEHIFISPESAAWLTEEVTGDIVATAPTVVEAMSSLTVAPNPVHRSATITLGLPGASRAAFSLHDVSGRLVARLGDVPVVNGRAEFRWDTLASDVPSGVYFLRATSDRGTLVRKLSRR